MTRVPGPLPHQHPSSLSFLRESGGCDVHLGKAIGPFGSSRNIDPPIIHHEKKKFFPCTRRRCEGFAKSNGCVNLSGREVTTLERTPPTPLSPRRPLLFLLSLSLIRDRTAPQSTDFCYFWAVYLNIPEEAKTAAVDWLSLLASISEKPALVLISGRP